MSSVTTHDDLSHLLFHDETSDNVENIRPLSHSQHLLLETFQGLNTANIANLLNSNKGAKKSSCKDTITLLLNYQLDSDVRKYMTNNLDDFEAC